MKKRRHWWVWLLVIGYIGFIFHNSLMVAEVSSQISYKVANSLITFVNKYGFYIDFNLFHRYIRKLAHFTEFAGLGFLVAIAMGICPLFKSKLLNFLLFLVTIPVTDETIQRYVSGRSSEVFDMFIDGLGLIFGGFVGYVIILIVKDLFFPRDKEVILVIDEKEADKKEKELTSE